MASDPISIAELRELGSVFELNSSMLEGLLASGLTPTMMMNSILIREAIKSSYSGSAASERALPTVREALQFGIEFVPEKDHDSANFVDLVSMFVGRLHDQAIKVAKVQGESAPTVGDTVRKALALKVRGDCNSTDPMISAFDLACSNIGNNFEWRAVDTKKLFQTPLSSVNGPARPDQAQGEQ